jgi:hypothetical protein
MYAEFFNDPAWVANREAHNKYLVRNAAAFWNDAAKTINSLTDPAGREDYRTTIRAFQMQMDMKAHFATLPAASQLQMLLFYPEFTESYWAAWAAKDLAGYLAAVAQSWNALPAAQRAEGLPGLRPVLDRTAPGWLTAGPLDAIGAVVALLGPIDKEINDTWNARYAAERPADFVKVIISNAPNFAAGDARLAYLNEVVRIMRDYAPDDYLAQLDKATRTDYLKTIAPVLDAAQAEAATQAAAASAEFSKKAAKYAGVGLVVIGGLVAIKAIAGASKRGRRG